jgi:ribonuclease BN (tRNA processing enzyme)
MLLSHCRRHFCHCDFCVNAVFPSQGATVLVHEATHEDAMEEMSQRYGHRCRPELFGVH